MDEVRDATEELPFTDALPAEDDAALAVELGAVEEADMEESDA